MALSFPQFSRASFLTLAAGCASLAPQMQEPVAAQPLAQNPQTNSSFLPNVTALDLGACGSACCLFSAVGFLGLANSLRKSYNTRPSAIAQQYFTRDEKSFSSAELAKYAKHYAPIMNAAAQQWVNNPPAEHLNQFVDERIDIIEKKINRTVEIMGTIRENRGDTKLWSQQLIKDQKLIWQLMSDAYREPLYDYLGI